MGDNNPPNPTPPKGGPMPPLPSSKEKPPGALTTQLPSARKPGGPGKVVVLLSSVAKPAPAGTQALPGATAPSGKASIIPPSAKTILRPPPLPVGKASSENPRLTSTTMVQMPPKGSAPSIAPAKPQQPAGGPPPLPVQPPDAAKAEVKKTGAHPIPPIKLNVPPPIEEEDDEPVESLFPDESKDAPATQAKPQGWKSLEPGELKLPPSKQGDTPAKLPPPISRPEASAPTLVPPIAARAQSVATTGPLAPPRSLPSAATPPPLQHAPPLVEKASTETQEKRPAPHLPSESVPVPNPSALVTPPSADKPTDKPADKPLPAITSKTPESETPKTSPTPSLNKTSAPLILPGAAAKAGETKPALKPAVMSKRALAQATGESKIEDPAPAPVAKKEEPPLLAASVAAAAAAVAIPPALSKTEAKAAPAEKPQATPVAKSEPASKPQPSPEIKIVPPERSQPMSKLGAAPVTKDKPPKLPVDSEAATAAARQARIKKRRMWTTVTFYAIFVVILIGLYYGSLYFGRDTRVEGQVIPPDGMTLNNEVWIVTDFRELASGLAEDLAGDRSPLLQEIEERQEHVERAQADIAAREERLRMINQEIQTTKDDMAALGKQARDATQQLWAGEGAEIDSEYAARSQQLQQTIAARAKSLNLKYAPDPNFNSPEVWANAYRLALYDVPASVDQTKEHQWLTDQMKAWHDYEKSLDDRRSKLLQQANDIRTSNGPKLTDLQAKIDADNQRADATEAEEVPLKAELQQAQSDLTEVQSADAGLDDKYYKQLDALPEENIASRIQVFPNGRFTWVVDESNFAAGLKEHSYWIFACATRSDGRQYWALGRFDIQKNHKVCLIIDPDSFVSTKAILRPNLSPAEQEQ